MSLRAIDEARARLVTIVTHELRTPLAVVRALPRAHRAGSPPTTGPHGTGSSEALRQVDRLDGMVDSILAGLRVLAEDPPVVEPIDVAAVDRDDGRVARPRSCAATGRTSSFAERPLLAIASAGPARPAPRVPPRERRQVRPAGGAIEIHGWREGGASSSRSPTTGRASRAAGASGSSSRSSGATSLARGAGIGLFAARHLARAMGGELRLEDRPPAGSQFVLELAASHGPGGPPTGA